MWPDFLLLCRSSPVGDVRRDLIGAWQRPQQAVSAGRPASGRERTWTRRHDRARGGHPQALAHGRRGRRGDGPGARRQDGRGRCPRVRGAGALGARPRWRAGVGAGGLPACLRRAGAVFDRARRACRSRLDAVDGRHAALQPRARQERSDRRGLGRAGGAGGGDRRRCRRRRWRARSSIIRLLVDHRERLVRTRVGAQQHAAVEPARPLARAHAARRRVVLEEVDARRSPGAWRAPSRRCASGSPATSCVACAS